MDPNVLTNFSLFLEYLKTQFDFVILISHIDIVKDIVDNQIEIKKENGYSKIDA
jgi:DNA repair exonuclease SbcCD ATPase subunit